MRCFVTFQRDIKNRLDVDFHRPENKALLDGVSKENYVPLSSLFPKVMNGFDFRGFSENGRRYLRVANIKPNYFDLDDVKLISDFEISKDIHLKEGDILLTRKGSYGISCVVSKEMEGSIISSEIFLLRKTPKINSYFLSIWFNSAPAQKLFQRIKTGAIMGHISQEALKEFLVPLPDRVIQDQIVALMDKAYAEKKALEAEADKLLASIDSYMLDQLGIALPRSTSRVCHSVLLSELVGKRCDPMPYQPLRLDMIKAISKGKYELKSLQEITAKKSSQEKENPSTLPYVGLENIGSNTGVYVESKDEKTEFGSALHFYPDNILFPKLRPYLNKVYHSTMEGFCSTEFHVLEAKPEILPSYLVAFLRSQAVVRQTSCLMTGNTLPRLQTEDVQTLPIPVPPKTVQKEMVSEVEKRRAEALRLKKQSMAKIDQAKAEVEKILFGGTA